MRATVAAGADGPAVAAPSFVDLAHTPTRTGRAVLGGMWGRVLHVTGRALVGLPPSSWLLVDVTLVAVAVYCAYLVFPPLPLVDTPVIARRPWGSSCRTVSSGSGGRAVSAGCTTWLRSP